MKHSLLSSACLALCLCAALPAAAEDAASTAANVAFMPADFGPAVISQHKGVFGGQKLTYDSIVKSYPVKDKTGRDALSVVTFSYVAKVKDASQRPVMFVFNGGPITPALYLQMGAFAPQRVTINPDLTATPIAPTLVDNTDSPLDATDIVFIDPAGTGFSRPLAGCDLRDWFSVKADGDEFAQVITAWMTANGRLNSPVYVFGESYGTIRAPQIMKDLAEADTPLTLGGVILFGQAANITDYVQHPTNIISYVVSLPTLAATAWYHQATDRKGLSLDAFVDEARTFADTEYLPALYQGDQIDATQKANVAAKLASFTGVPAQYFLDNRLRLSKEGYRRLLFKDKGLLIGQSDTRYVGPAAAGDPASAVPRAYEAGFNTYLHDVLKINSLLPYLTASPVTDEIGAGWSYGGADSPFVDYPFYAMISDALKKQPTMKIFVGNGYFDTQTTVGAAELLLKQSGWPRANTQLRLYEGGHMTYSNPAALTKIAADVRAFVKAGQ
jgi:carboxypeptidase C (cathepsin A)